MFSKAFAGLFLVHATQAHSIAQYGTEWCYHAEQATGASCLTPDQWNITGNNFDFCGFKSNSPVDIVNSGIAGFKDSMLEDLNINWYNGSATVTTQNLGYATALVGDTSPLNTMSVQGGPLDYRYNFDKMLIRTPSEHKMHGKFKKAELQLLYNKEGEAEPWHVSNGLVQVSIMVNRGKHNNEIQKIIDMYNNSATCVDCANTMPVLNFTMSELFPKHYYKDYYTYEGSQAMPPCHQSVVHIIFKHTITMSRDQLYFFTDIQMDTNGNKQGENTRPIVDRHHRMISRSYGKTGCGRRSGGLSGFGR